MKVKKVLSFLNRLVNIKESKSTHIYNYDLDNKFPQTLIKILDESPTGTACVERKAEYIYAKGFIDDTAGSLKVNPFQTANDLLNEIKYQASTFECIAVHVSRKADGSVGMIKQVPFELLRKNSNGDIIFNPTFGESKYNAELDVRYSKFLGTKITTDTLNFLMEEYPNGEIIYHFRKKPAKHIYPIPAYYSSVESIMADAEFGKYKLESVNNSFLPSGILTLVGDVDDNNKDDSGMTEWDYIESQLEAFTGNVKDPSGNTGRQKLMVLHAKSKEELPTYTTLNNADILNSANESRKDTASTICSAMGVPPFLIGLDGTIGFASNIIADNIELFNNSINDLKNLCEDIFKVCFPQYDWSISSLSPIKYIPDSILNDLTADERRALVGYPAKELNVPSEGEKLLSTLNSLSPLIATKILEYIPQDKLLEAIGIKSEDPSLKVEQNPTQVVAEQKISFDFDDTLSTAKGKELASKLISEGNLVYIISARSNKEGMLDVAGELNIPESRVYATGSNNLKIEKIKELGINKHYDNNADVINELGSIGEKFTNKSSFNIFNKYSAIEAECLLEIENAVPTQEEIDQRYKDYYDAVNMTYSELQRWSETDCSRKASVNRAPINRNLELLNINKPDWTPKHFRWAGQTIAFVNRMKDGEQGEVIEECGISKRDISLKNWAFDPKK